MENRDTIVLTGGSRGIGFAIINHLIENSDYQIISIARKHPQNIKLPERVHLIDHDLGDANSLELLWVKLNPFRDRLLALINNAATTSVATIKDVSNKKIEQIINLNINANIHLSRFFLNCVGEGEEAVIINISGAGAGWQITDSGRSLYFASKAWLMAFTEALASEYKGSDVVHYAISPNGVDTKLRQEIQQAQKLINGGKDIGATDVSDNAIDKIVECILLLIGNKPKHLSGSTISPVWDNLQKLLLDTTNDENFGKLRRIDRNNFMLRQTKN